jgi:hypothetical protein
MSEIEELKARMARLEEAVMLLHACVQRHPYTPSHQQLLVSGGYGMMMGAPPCAVCGLDHDAPVHSF